MRRARFGWIVFCALVATSGCRRVPSPDWNGTWKLNPSRGNFQGPIFTISISADGVYRYDDASSSFIFRCDGKDHPIGENRMQACVTSSATTLDLTRHENGVKTNANRWELSAGGKSLTFTRTAFHPNGPVVITQAVASRMSGSNGFAGQWRDTSYLQRIADMTLSLDNQTLHIGYPSDGLYIDAPLDGVDAAMHGPRASERVTYSARLVGSREILTLKKHTGNADIRGSFELSRDGKVITEFWWNSDQPAGKGRFVYEKK
jgi:hypothetical protein